MFKNRCGVHMSEERSFCALEKDHYGNHSKYPEKEKQGVEFPKEIRDVRREIADLGWKVADLQKLEQRLKQEAKVKCLGWTVGVAKHCGTMLPVKDLTYIQTHWYTEPYGCTGGDYWNQGEGQFTCPVCGALNRLYERPDVVALKSFFKTVVDVYDR
jgi:hypothetical protein